MSRRTPALLAGVALLVAAAAAHADEKADALFQKAREAVERARTMQADMVYLGPQKQGFSGTLRLMKPNVGKVELNPTGPQGKMIHISDGKNTFTVTPGNKIYEKDSAPAKGVGFISDPSPGAPNAAIVAFFDPASLVATPEHHAEGTKEVDGRSYQVVTLPLKGERPGTMRYLFADSGLLEGVEMEMKTGAESITMSLWLKNVKLDAPMKIAEFAYTPPAGFKVRVGPEGSLLAVGKKAPEFRLPTPGGGELSLTAAREGKKAVLVNFWFYG